MLTLQCQYTWRMECVVGGRREISSCSLYSILAELILQRSKFVFVVLLPTPGFLVLRSLAALSPTFLQKIIVYSVLLTLSNNPGRRGFEQVQERPCNFSIVTWHFSFWWCSLLLVRLKKFSVTFFLLLYSTLQSRNGNVLHGLQDFLLDSFPLFLWSLSSYLNCGSRFYICCTECKMLGKSKNEQRLTR